MNKKSLKPKTFELFRNKKGQEAPVNFAFKAAKFIVVLLVIIGVIFAVVKLVGRALEPLFG